jgi:hypothetical protein
MLLALERVSEIQTLIVSQKTYKGSIGKSSMPRGHSTVLCLVKHALSFGGLQGHPLHVYSLEIRIPHEADSNRTRIPTTMLPA